MWSRKAFESVRRLPRPVQRGLVAEIDRLGRGAPPNTRRVVGGQEYRFHAGDYNVFFDMQDGALRVLHVAAPPAPAALR